MFTPVAIAWNVLALAGQAGLLLLLLTFLFVQTLPQRKNPFFMNMILCMFLTTIPAVLLLITGQQGGITIPSICFAQSAMMDGVAPMWGVAVLILIFQVWRELGAIAKGRKSWVSQSYSLRVALLLVPYITFLAWTVWSGVGALKSPDKVGLEPFVFCSDRGSHYPARVLVGPFLVICCTLAFVFEILTAFVLCSKRQKSGDKDVSVLSTYQYHVTTRIFLRMAAFTFLQLGPIILTIMTKTNHSKSRVQSIDNALQLVEISYPLAMFFLFATQRNILEAWRIIPRRNPDSFETKRCGV